MKKLTRKKLKKIKGGSGGIGFYCGEPYTSPATGTDNYKVKKCLDPAYPIYDRETDCCIEKFD